MLTQSIIIGILIFLGIPEPYIRTIAKIDATICSIGFLLLILSKLHCYLHIDFSCKINRHKLLHIFMLKPIIIIILIYTIYTIILYPMMLELPGIDITRTLSNSILLLVNKDLFYSNYFLFNLLLLFLYIISDQNFFVTEIICQIFSIIVPLSFYVMAKIFYLAYYRRKYEPLISIFLFMMGGGFGWVILFKELSSHKIAFSIHILKYFVSETAKDISEGGTISLWLWLRAQSIGYAILFMLISLFVYGLYKKYISLKDIIVLFILVFYLIFVHFPEFILWLLILLSATIFFSNNNKKEISKVLLSTLAAFSFSYLFSIFFISNIISNIISYEIFIIIALFMIVMIIESNFRLLKRVAIVIIKNYMSILIGFIVLLIYCLGFVDPHTFTTALGEIMGVPLEVWAMLLGIPFYLAFFSLSAKRNYDFDGEKIYFIFLTIILTIFLGRTITFININTRLLYFEWRLVPFAFSLSCLLSEIGIKKIIDRIKRIRILLLIQSKGNIISKINVTNILVFLVFLVIFTTSSISNILSTVYWYSLVQEGKLTSKEKDIILLLKNFVNHSILLTTDTRLTWVSEYTVVGVNAWLMGNLRNVLLDSSNPFFIADVLGKLKGFDEKYMYILVSNDTILSLLRSIDSDYIGHLLYFYGSIVKEIDSIILARVPRPGWVRDNSVVMVIDPYFDLPCSNITKIIINPYNDSNQRSFDEFSIFFRAAFSVNLGNKIDMTYLILENAYGANNGKYKLCAHYQFGRLSYVSFEIVDDSEYQIRLPVDIIPKISEFHNYVLVFKKENNGYAGYWYVDGELVAVSSIRDLARKIHLSQSPLLLFERKSPLIRVEFMIIYNRALSHEEVKILNKGCFYISHSNILNIYISNILKKKIIVDAFLINKIPFELYSFGNVNKYDTIIIPLFGNNSEVISLLLKSNIKVKNLVLLVDDKRILNSTLYLDLNTYTKNYDINLIILPTIDLFTKFLTSNNSERLGLLSNFTLNLFKSLNKSLVLVNTSETPSIPFYRFNIAFKNSLIDGNILLSVNLCRIIFYNETTINIINSFGKTVQIIHNVSEILIVAHKELIFNINRIEIFGNDYNLVLANLTNLYLLGNNLQIDILMTNGSRIFFDNASILISVPKCLLSTLALNLSANRAIATFRRATTLGDLASIMVTRSWMNEDLKISGDINLSICYGGTMLVVNKLFYKGSIIRYSNGILYPKYAYDDSKSFVIFILAFTLCYINKIFKKLFRWARKVI
jgi:hypothetical protein